MHTNSHTGPRLLHVSNKMIPNKMIIISDGYAHNMIIISDAFSDIKRGAAERIISYKARIARMLNGLRNDPFYAHLVSLFVKDS